MATTTVSVTEVGRTQGLTSDLDDLLLLGQKWRAQVGDALTTGTLERTIEGASTLTLDIHDEDRTLLNSDLLQAPFTVELDGLRFAYVKASMGGLSAPLSLTFEAATVDRLRQLKGPRKAFRDKLTRAEFFNRLRLEAAKGWGKIPFHAPQLHKTQQIKTARDSRTARTSAKTERRGGLDAKANLTVKGAKASSAQVAMGDRIMRIGVSVGAPQRALVAGVVAAIVESEMSNVAGGTGSSRGVFQLLDSTASGMGLDPMDVEACTRAFFLKGFTGQGGAIANAKAGHPPDVIADRVEGPQAGASSYSPYVTEAREWVEQYGGEGASISITDTTRYAYEVEKKETYWAAMTRLAEEVNWRLFESNGRIYYVAEPFLMRSMRRIEINDVAPGVEDLSFDYDRGKPINELSVQARARAWQAPPGTVAEVSRCGPADGRYLVSSISAPLRTKNSLCEITLKRPSKPLKEPSPETETRSVNFGATASASAAGNGMGVLSGTPEDVVNTVIDYAHVNGFSAVTRASVRAANATHGPTVSGSTSDHQGPPTVRWAADISNGSSPTKEMTHLAAAIAKAFDIPWSGAGLVTKAKGKYRMQLIYKTMEGGDHFDHVHFGVSV